MKDMKKVKRATRRQNEFLGKVLEEEGAERNKKRKTGEE